MTMGQPPDPVVHYGTPRHSGRYPWGSGKDPMQSGRDIHSVHREMRRSGLTEKQVADRLNLTTTELRAKVSIAKSAKRQDSANMALRLKNKGLSTSEIGRRMGMPESTVRTLLDPAMKDRRDILETTSSFLKDKVDKDGPLDIGSGTETWQGISKTRLSTAVAILKEQGYVVRNIQVPQLGTKTKTTIKVLLPPGSEKKFIPPDTIKSLAAWSEDGGRSFKEAQPPVNISSKRIAIRYGPEGGDQADGVIYVRPGVPDLALGSSRYAQVRIAVDKTHYMKGMAMYKEDLPPGVDLQFNTSAKRNPAKGKLGALKENGPNPDMPFEASIERQRTYIGRDGKEHQSAMNIVNEEGRWKDWSPSLSSQVLSKQSTALARQQLGRELKRHADNLKEIQSLTNPVVKDRLLRTFGDEADRAAVDLKAHAMPGQGTHVILPFSSIKRDEVFAPNYNNGERVVLIRHPHGGTFEIPTLTVNNRNKEARAALGPGAAGRAHGAVDAIGIHPDVAKRLSGADFDGDAVLVIPNPRGSIKTTAALSALDKFDPREAYPPYDGMRTIDGGTWSAKEHKAIFPPGVKPKGAPKQQKMGEVSNLITDMTIMKARPEEIARAVKHSMVVIDAEKHSLDERASYEANGIRNLKEKYQGIGRTGRPRGASTIISRAGAESKIPEIALRTARRGGPIDPETGRKVFEPTGRSFVNKEGRVIPLKSTVTRLGQEADARNLLSDAATPMERIYADHSNALKDMANKARLEALRTGGIKYSPSAARVHAAQVARLNAALALAEKNAPLERQAQLLGNHLFNARLRDNPHLQSDPDAKRKAKFQELQKARIRVGAKKHQIEISDEEWRAIQEGAITTHKLRRIIANSNIDKLRELATPRSIRVVTPSMIALARARLASGATQAEVARSLGIPASTLNTALLNKEAEHAS